MHAEIESGSSITGERGAQETPVLTQEQRPVRVTELCRCYRHRTSSCSRSNRLAPKLDITSNRANWRLNCRPWLLRVLEIRAARHHGAHCEGGSLGLHLAGFESRLMLWRCLSPR